MKKILIFITIFIVSISLQAQNSRALRAAKASFESAEKNYKRGDFQQAAREFEIVINTIPSTTDSRKNLKMRLESLIALVDIYFYKYVSIDKACSYLDMYSDNINRIRNQETLRASELLTYQRKEKEFEAEDAPNCRNYREIDLNMEEFKKKFDAEFEK